jgi:diacylglycerol kinase family enzyme
MKHLFIINPKAGLVRDRKDRIIEEIKIFFGNYPEFSYEIHVTRWKRDAVGFIRRYLSRCAELVRVYATGGTGTLFEIINAVAGLPNVQVAYYPHGRVDSFIHAFGEDKEPLFHSLRNLVFAPVAGLDIIKWGNNFGINGCFIGLSALAYQDSSRFLEKTGFPYHEMTFHLTLIKRLLLGKSSQYYRIELDGQKLNGEYLNITIPNIPHIGERVLRVAEASPTDGLLHLYLIKKTPRTMAFQVYADYETGRYEKWPEYISHHSGKRIFISSPAMMTIAFDGEIFYNDRLQYDIIPRGIDFVCPGGMDPARNIFNAQKHAEAPQARENPDVDK